LTQSNISTPGILPNTIYFFLSVGKLTLTTALKSKQLFQNSTSDADLILKLKLIVAC